MKKSKYFSPEITIAQRQDYAELLDNYQAFPCTLLIPADLYKLLEKHLKENFKGSFSIFFREVMSHDYKAAIQDWFPKSRSVKTRYQERSSITVGRAGEDGNKAVGYRRVNFRATSWSWSVLGNLSMGTGLSRCLVFALLLRVALGLIEIVPTKIEKESWRGHSKSIICSRSISTETQKYTRTIIYLHKKHAAYDLDKITQDFFDKIKHHTTPHHTTP